MISKEAIFFLGKESLSSYSGTIRILSGRYIWGFASVHNILLGGALAYGVKSIYFKKKYLNLKFVNLISIILNPINRINFYKYETSKLYKYRDLFIDKK